eukprot:347318-Prymnesium_polylepis.1
MADGTGSAATLGVAAAAAVRLTPSDGSLTATVSAHATGESIVERRSTRLYVRLLRAGGTPFPPNESHTLVLGGLVNPSWAHTTAAGGLRMRTTRAGGGAPMDAYDCCGALTIVPNSLELFLAINDTTVPGRDYRAGSPTTSLLIFTP